MCKQSGTTREHVPPKSFFPPGYQTNLWTVKSCPDHNNSNSADVEYVRNLVVMHLGAAGEAHQGAQERVVRSFEHSPKLFMSSFRDAREIDYEGQEAIQYTFDRHRFKQVMESIAYAVHFRVRRQRMSKSWDIFSPTLHTARSIQGLPDDWSQYRDMIKSLTLTPLKTPQPDVFQCSFQEWRDEEVIYRFDFYRGFIVYALSQSRIILGTGGVQFVMPVQFRIRL